MQNVGGETSGQRSVALHVGFIHIYRSDLRSEDMAAAAAAADTVQWESLDDV